MQFNSNINRSNAFATLTLGRNIYLRRSCACHFSPSHSKARGRAFLVQAQRRSDKKSLHCNCNRSPIGSHRSGGCKTVARRDGEALESIQSFIFELKKQLSTLRCWRLGDKRVPFAHYTLSPYNLTFCSYADVARQIAACTQILFQLFYCFNHLNNLIKAKRCLCAPDRFGKLWGAINGGESRREEGDGDERKMRQRQEDWRVKITICIFAE